MRHAHALVAILGFTVTGCADRYPGPLVERRLRVLPQDTVRMVRNRAGADVPVRAGGFGSALAVDAAGKRFYLLTDRGPNVDGALADSKIFPIRSEERRVGRGGRD